MGIIRNCSFLLPVRSKHSGDREPSAGRVCAALIVVADRVQLKLPCARAPSAGQTRVLLNSHGRWSQNPRSSFASNLASKCPVLKLLFFFHLKVGLKHCNVPGIVLFYFVFLCVVW